MGKTEIAQDTYLVGIGVSPGIAIGEICLLSRQARVMEWQIEDFEVEEEIERFTLALEQAKVQLRQVKENVSSKPHLREHLYILDTHLLILEDNLLVQQTIAEIKKQINAEGALKRTLTKLRQMFDSIEDEYLRERRSDVDAIGDRLQRILAGEYDRDLGEIGKRSLLAAHDLSPADTMQIDKENVLGFITDSGGRTSHTAILARSLEIPAVVGLETVTAIAENRTPAIIDGTTGVVILNPSAETFKEYLQRKQTFEYRERDLLGNRELPARTRDHFTVTLRGNLEATSEVQAALKYGVEGVGLYRTEFLYMNRESPPCEEEQAAAYGQMLKEMAPHSVTIRTLDLGGDKVVSDMCVESEVNPAMGLRAIRFSLKEVELFKTQLRAILRASIHGNVRIMLPMISGVAEIRACKKLLHQVQEDLSREGVPFAENIPIGIMVETPSAILIAPLLAREVDYFSIGTNDLIQYCLAVDRGNEHVAYLYEPMHPAILRALKAACDAARDADIDISICGEMAAEPLYALVLLGLGFNELSMNPSCVPRVKQVIRQLRRQDGEVLLERLMLLPTGKEIAACIEQEMRTLLPDIFDLAMI
ncbi:MAG: phosphoenolpyruvate--protein phosphotransferase [Desulfuromonas sp.]|nr:MAG: phosphoenolpyruvate--protein phosphotransferase [Desulfuromonas sp.]